MGSLMRELRHAGRLLLNSPIFTTLAVLSLALGIGANTAVFTLVNALLLRPLPVAEPDRLTRVVATDKEGNTGAFAYLDYKDYQDQNKTFAGLLAHAPLRVGLNTGQGSPEIVFGELVTPNYFSVLGVKAALGTTFQPEAQEVSGRDPVVVLSHNLWRSRLGADPDVVGQIVRVDGYPFTVVGVAPGEFQGTLEGGILPASLWIPTTMAAQVGSENLENRNAVGFEVIGRLKPGVALESAQADMSNLARNLEREYPDTSEDFRKKRLVQLIELNTVLPSMRGVVVVLMSFLLGVVGLVLLIACTNLANMLLVRMSTRAREFATRLALGAKRGNLIGQILVESLLLALLGGGLGLLLAYWAVQWLTRIQLPTPVPIEFNLGMDWRVLTFTFAISLLTVLFFGLIPAFQATRVSPATVLKEDTSGGRGKGNRLRKTFVVAQLTLSMILLMFSGLLLRSLRNVSHIDPGFDVENGLALAVDLTVKDYARDEAYRFFDQLLERTRALPGVQEASFAYRIPLTSGNSTSHVRIPGNEEWAEVDTNLADAEYFETMGIPVLQGRAFSVRDDENAPRAVVVSQAMASRYWPGQPAVGQRLEVRSEGVAEVIGVVADSNYRSLQENPLPHVYRSFRQEYQAPAILLVRAQGVAPDSLVAPIRAAVNDLDPDIPIFDVKTLREHVSISVLPARMAAMLLGILGVLTLILAGVGIYGVMAYSVGQRTHEIGIRVSVGAQQSDILRMLLVQGLRLVLVGIGLGIALAFGLTRFASSLLYGVSSTDPLTFVGIAVLLGAISLVAIFIPARRAMRLDPRIAMRHQ